MGTDADKPLTLFPVEPLKSAFTTSVQQSDDARVRTGEREKSKNEAEEIYNLETGLLMGNVKWEEDALSGGTRIRSNLNHVRPRTEQKKWQRLTDLLLWRAVEDALARVEEIIEYHQAQMDVLAELIREARTRLADLAEQKKALMKELEHFRKTGEFELDEKGALKNATAEKSLKAWEERTGVHVDRSSPSSYLPVQEAISDLETQEAGIKADIERDEADYRFHKMKRDEALEIKKALESDDPEHCRQGLERLEELDNYQKHEVTANSLTEEPTSENRSQLLGQTGLTKEDLQQADFSFGFPPLQDDFNKAGSSKAEEAEPVNDTKPKFVPHAPGPHLR